MRIYEEYKSPKEKRQAQKGASRGVATGKARGYLLVFNEDGIEYHYNPYTAVYNAIGELMADTSPGCGPQALCHCTPSLDYLRTKCRFVGFDSIPEEWKRAFGRHLDSCLRNEDDPGCCKRYRRVLKYARGFEESGSRIANTAVA